MPLASARRVLVAPDSFKGTFTATEVAEAIGRGVREAGSEADLCPVADGGEGTLEVLLAALGGERVGTTAHDPLRRPIRAEFGLLAGGEAAVVEVATASGLPLVAPQERDAERADSFGTGELVVAAIAAGARSVLIAAGGSATTDGGRGAIEAIRAGAPSRAEALTRADAQVGRTRIEGVELEVLCDVDARFEDAARVFAPQKGADPAAVARLSRRLDEFAATLPHDPRGVPMGGCAGGLSGGLMAAFGARLRPGAGFVLDRVGFDQRLARADAVIAGEGQIDPQSLGGKIVGAVAERCAAAGVRLDVIAGRDALDPDAAHAAGITRLRVASTLTEISAAARALASEPSPDYKNQR
jgi:glycerate kinase